jgi:membrane protein involved in colicin uptake
MKPLRFVALLLLGLLLAAFAATGCGSEPSDNSTQGAAATQHARELAQQRAAQRRAKARREARIRVRKAQARQARRAAVRQERAEQRQAEAEEVAAVHAEEEATEEESSECDPNYAGACLEPSASDYDCEGGSGDGPYYTGTVSVVGEDRHGLDANSNGVGCEE